LRASDLAGGTDERGKGINTKSRKWVEAGKKSWRTRRNNLAWKQAHASEAQSKSALRRYCEERGWRVAFFEGPTGAPRTGIIDAIAYRLGREDPDEMNLRLIQLKGGRAGVTAEEIGRLKQAVNCLKSQRLMIPRG
jgi:hypothetical protein